MNHKFIAGIFFCIFFVLINSSLTAQHEGQKDFDPISPIRHPLVLSGSFGELRNNHFHAGIDIKSSKWNKSGDPILAVEDGFISRINVRGTGYGNALYIDHPGGFTSVYGHLDKFTDPVAEYVRTAQHLKEGFAVNLFPDSLQFKVKKGEVIGYMGNTGRSTAAHLHFEIRHTKSEKTINPYHFNIGPEDSRAPTLLNINIVHLLPDTTIINRDRLSLNYVKPGHYTTPEDTMEVNAWRVGLELNGFDRMNNASNKNGIYEMLMMVNGSKSFHYKLDSFSFDEDQHINAHINYPDYYDLKRRYQRCYILPADPLSIYESIDTALAIVPLYQGKAQFIQLIAKDFKGNETKVEFWLKRKKEMKDPPPLIYNYVLEEGKTHLIREEDYILYFNDSSLYQNAYLHLSQSDTVEPPLHSRHLFLNANNIFKNHVDIFLKPVGIPDSLLKKATIVSCGGKNLVSYGGDIFEDYISSKINRFGDYAIYLDTIPPELTAIKFSEGLNYDRITFKISDNLKTSGRAKGISFKGFIDGNWVLFEFDAKSNTITHHFDKNLTPGKHLLRIELDDDRKNRFIFERKFIKK